MDECRVCGAALKKTIYASDTSNSITSMCEFLAGPTKVFFCDRCGHTQTAEIPDVNKYYDTQYNILVDSDDEDAIYRVVDGKKLFRVEHQINTILSKLDLPRGAKVLDYGCAKSATGRKLLEARPDLAIHLFDVSRAYVGFWEKFVSPDRWATYEPKAEWNKCFDAVLSFFALEHAAKPRDFVTTLGRLLKPDGHLHLLVPNVYANTADLVVVDHINHFSSTSLRQLLVSVGFDDIVVDADAHDAAFVVNARMTSSPRSLSPDQAEIQWCRRQVEEMSSFWGSLGARIRTFADQHAGERAAIYGSGFYGTFIGSSLRDLSSVECFLDQNPFRQSKQLLGKSIIAPETVAADIPVVYVGLNPRIAHQTMETIGAFRAHPRVFFFL